MARENPTQGYTRIRDQLNHLGNEVGRTTVVDILREAGLTPEPEQRRERTWAEFIEQHRSVIWATDFLTVDTLAGCFYVLFFIHLATRRVVLGGITDHPREVWLKQMAPNVTDGFDGPLLEAKHLIHDSHTKYTASFDHIISSAGIGPVKLPSRPPNLNSYAERWVLSANAEALDRLILLDGRQVWRVLYEYLAHYDAERAHHGPDGDLIEPESARSGDSTGETVRSKRLYGLLSYYHRPRCLRTEGLQIPSLGHSGRASRCPDQLPERSRNQRGVPGGASDTKAWAGILPFANGLHCSRVCGGPRDIGQWQE